MALNVAEAFENGAGNTRLRLQSALGSLYEARAGLRLAAAWRYVALEECADVLATNDRALAFTV